MKTIIVGLRFISRVVFGLLLAYWFFFLVYTIKNLVDGGPSGAAVWYRHLSGAAFQWNWKVFLIQQIMILTFTLAAWFFGIREPDRSVSPRS